MPHLIDHSVAFRYSPDSQKSASILPILALFVFAGVIAWPEGIAMIAGAIAGGYLSARISRRTPQTYVKGFVMVASTIITLYFFYSSYLV